MYLSKLKDCSPEVLVVLVLLQLLSIPLKANRDESSSTILLTKSSRPENDQKMQLINIKLGYNLTILLKVVLFIQVHNE